MGVSELSGERAQAAVSAYLDELAHQRRVSPRTLESYGHDLRVLLQLAGLAALDALSPHDIRRYSAQLHGRGLTGRSIAHALSAWRGFYKWLARHHGVAQNPCQAVRAPKSKKALPTVLSPDEAKKFLSDEIKKYRVIISKAGIPPIE